MQENESGTVEMSHAADDEAFDKDCLHCHINNAISAFVEERRKKDPDVYYEIFDALLDVTTEQFRNAWEDPKGRTKMVKVFVKHLTDNVSGKAVSKMQLN